jgi:N6-L-threonylcarbamoyladenine synthase
MLVLGIESSCDETAAAIVTDDRRILANIVHSQIAEHAPYGGVVPEIAARAHVSQMDTVIASALKAAQCGWSAIDAVAATAGPGLIGGVIVGASAGKAIASVLKKPFLAINHLEGHALTARLTDDVPFPYLLLLVSGGHCQLLEVQEVGRYRLLGRTLDDALGEAFDKSAKMMGLGYPGGPRVEKLAEGGDPLRFSLPRPLEGREGCDFSFSGLKTAMRLAIEKLGTPAPQDIRDLCASFQHTVGLVLEDRLKQAFRLSALPPEALRLVVAGGVAANRFLKSRLETLCEAEGWRLTVPPPALCTDNAAMIAWAGIERRKRGWSDPLDFEPKARWPLPQEAVGNAHSFVK